MSDDKYEGWTNRETWAVALHINNDQGWQESVHEALREAEGEYEEGTLGAYLTEHPILGVPTPDPVKRVSAHRAGEIIRESVEGVLSDMLDVVQDSGRTGINRRGIYEAVRDDIGSLWRVDWQELGAAFLADLAEQGE